MKIFYTLSFGLFALTALVKSFTVEAEVQLVQVLYNPVSCQQSCIDLMNKEFRKQPGVADISFNQPGGQANISWKPNVPFSFQAIQSPMAMVGLYIQTLRVKAKGTIQHDKDNVYLISIGDGTKFTLYAPIQPSTVNYTEKYNPDTHVLTPEMRAEFIDAESKDQLVTAEGPLFMPYRAPPLYLVVERSKVEDKSQDPEQQSQNPADF